MIVKMIVAAIFKNVRNNGKRCLKCFSEYIYNSYFDFIYIMHVNFS